MYEYWARLEVKCGDIKGNGHETVCHSVSDPSPPAGDAAADVCNQCDVGSASTPCNGGERVPGTPSATAELPHRVIMRLGPQPAAEAGQEFCFRESVVPSVLRGTLRLCVYVLLGSLCWYLCNVLVMYIGGNSIPLRRTKSKY